MSISRRDNHSPIPPVLCLGDVAIMTAKIQDLFVNDGQNLNDKSIGLNVELDSGKVIRWPFKSAEQLNLFLGSLDLHYTPTTETGAAPAGERSAP